MKAWRILGMCAALAAPAADAFGQDDYLFAVTTEFETSGNCATVGLDSPWTAQTNLRQIGSDPQVRYFDGLIYVVNRFLSDNIQVLDPARSFATIAEHSVGAGSNPQDIVVIDPGRAYVTRYESTWMYEFDPSTGMVLDSIDLSLFADADGLPEMSRIVRDGDMLFVQVQRIDRDNFWTPLVPGYLAVIDMTTNQVVDADPGTAGVQPIELAGANPNGQMVHDKDAGLIYVSLLGNYGVNDGGVDVVDIDLLSSTGWMTTEAQLGGDIGPIAITAAKGYAVVSSDFFTTNDIVAFSRTTGAKGTTALAGAGFISDIEYDAETSRLFVCDRDATTPGVRVINTLTDSESTSSPIATGMPPFDLAVVRPVEVGVADTAGIGPFPERVTWAQPNPFGIGAAGTEIFFRIGPGAPGEISVYDIRGRIVRELRGEGSVIWDGRDRRGRVASPGLYFYRVKSAGNTATGRITLLK